MILEPVPKTCPHDEIGRVRLGSERLTSGQREYVGFRSRNEIEGAGVARTYDTEVAPVEGGDPVDREPLSDDDQTRVRTAETKVGICLDQIGDPPSIGGCEHLDLDLARGHGTEERFRRGADLPADEVGSFGDHERGGYERARALDRRHAAVMIGVGVVGSRE